jgi:predicted signal transduction protein with EAL and GGDEF domain
VAGKVVAAISEPIDFGGAQVHLSASVGVCTSPEHGTDAERLMHCADAAIYLAKASGRNSYQVYCDTKQTFGLALSIITGKCVYGDTHPAPNGSFFKRVRES